jgi:uncharacterized protein
MEQRVSLITLGVDDLARSSLFYEAMGWRGQEVEQTVFFQAGGLALVLWGRQNRADDAGAETSERRAGFDGVALAQNVRSRQEVDDIISAAERAGGRVTRPPAENVLRRLRRALRGSWRSSLGGRPQPGLQLGRRRHSHPSGLRRELSPQSALGGDRRSPLNCGFWDPLGLPPAAGRPTRTSRVRCHSRDLGRGSARSSPAASKGSR